MYFRSDPVKYCKPSKQCVSRQQSAYKMSKCFHLTSRYNFNDSVGINSPRGARGSSFLWVIAGPSDPSRAPRFDHFCHRFWLKCLGFCSLITALAASLLYFSKSTGGVRLGRSPGPMAGPRAGRRRGLRMAAELKMSTNSS